MYKIIQRTLNSEQKETQIALNGWMKFRKLVDENEKFLILHEELEDILKSEISVRGIQLAELHKMLDIP